MSIEVWKRRPDSSQMPEARAAGGVLTDVFAPLLRARSKNTTCVVGQLGLSLDGRIATEAGESRYINGKDALTHLHRVRALVDAVVVGAGTAIADDPRLNVRHVEGRDPARVVIDPNGRVAPTAKVWRNDGCRRVVFGGHSGLPSEVERLPAKPGQIPVPELVRSLARIGLRRLLIEGGAETLRRFLVADAVDCLHLLYGRVIIGSGKPGLELPAVTSLSDAIRPQCSTCVFPDGDVLIACDLRPGRS